MQKTATGRDKIYSIRDIPPDGILEFIFHFYLVYSMLMVSFGIYIPNSGGVLLLGLVGLTLVIVKWDQVEKSLLVLVVAVAGFHILVQVLVYLLPVLSYYVRPFIFWIPMAVVVYALSHRPGFIKRLALVMFIIAVLLLPSLEFIDATLVQRARLQAESGIDNPNAYAAWLAFCALVFWLWSWKPAGRGKKILLIGLAFAAVLIMTLTVSRSSVFALAAGILLGLRAIPRKQWHLVVLSLVFILLLSLTLPFLQQTVLRYQTRLLEETGRTAIWRVSLRAISVKPILGYGVNRIGGGRNIHSEAGNVIPYSSPHNGVILLWLSSGILPVIPFLLMWLLALGRGWRHPPLSNSSHLDPLPLILFAFLLMLVTNINFMTPWAIAALGYCFAIPKIYTLSPREHPFHSRNDSRRNIGPPERLSG